MLRQQYLHSFSTHLFRGVTKLSIVELCETTLTLASTRDLLRTEALWQSLLFEEESHFPDLLDDMTVSYEHLLIDEIKRMIKSFRKVDRLIPKLATDFIYIVMY